MEALHPLYSYDDHSVCVGEQPATWMRTGLKLTTKVYNLDMSEKFSQETHRSMPPPTAPTRS